MATTPIQPHEAVADLNKAKAELDKALEQLKLKPSELSQDKLEELKNASRAFFGINGIC